MTDRAYAHSQLIFRSLQICWTSSILDHNSDISRKLLTGTAEHSQRSREILLSAQCARFHKLLLQFEEIRRLRYIHVLQFQEWTTVYTEARGNTFEIKNTLIDCSTNALVGILASSVPTIHRQTNPSDPARVLTRQDDSHSSDTIRQTRSLQRMPTSEILPRSQMSGRLLEDCSLRIARAKRIGMDSVRRIIQSHLSGQLAHGALGCTV